jgi:hypothetical protein
VWFTKQREEKLESTLKSQNQTVQTNYSDTLTWDTSSVHIVTYRVMTDEQRNSVGEIQFCLEAFTLGVCRMQVSISNRLHGKQSLDHVISERYRLREINRKFTIDNK